MHHHITSSRQVQVSPLPASTWKCLWKLKIHHRLRLFLWKSIWNILPTKTRISTSILNSTMDTSCSLCSFPTDSLFHLFFSCPIARVVWQNSFWPLDILALRMSSMVLWLDIILYLEKVGIPLSDTHLFRIFALVYGEAKAAFLACQLALSLYLSQFILEGDSLTVALSLQKPTLTQDWRISPIISQIMLAIPPTTSWAARHVNRSANIYTHHVANWVVTKFLSSYIPNFSFCSESFPPCFGRKSISSFLVP
jgi:hypothetical protein